MALPYADNLSEVAGFSGGIVGTCRHDIVVVGNPEFGASVYTASTLLAVRRLRPDLRCAMTLGLKPGLKRALEKAGIETVWIDRDRQPVYIEDKGGRLEEWGAFEGMKNHLDPGKVQAVGDPGGVGCEPLVRILAEDLSSLEAMLSQILEFRNDSVWD